MKFPIQILKCLFNLFNSKHLLIQVTEKPVNNVTVLIIVEIVNEEVG